MSSPPKGVPLVVSQYTLLFIESRVLSMTPLRVGTFTQEQAPAALA